MKNITTSIIILLCFTCANAFAQNLWSNPSYSKGTSLVYGGVGALSRHLEPGYFKSYDYYLKSPFVALGFDLQAITTGQEHWGAGIYLSFWHGQKSRQINGNEVQKNWSSALAALKISHHDKFFISRRWDFSSIYMIGTRVNMTQSGSLNAKFDKPQAVTYSLALGLGAMIKYYYRPNIFVYSELTLGYKVDLVQFGLGYRFKHKH
ncbi:MAG: hypothetical protein JNL60_03940 [Bacteroidia bacterium]|nr:hypothetical protein [Bacteroidia bacterium]